MWNWSNGGRPWKRVERRCKEQRQSARVWIEWQQEVSICNCPAAAGHRIQIHVYGKHPAEQWIQEYIIEQEDTVRMKQREEDYVWVSCDMRIPLHVNGTIHKRIVQPPMLYDIETGSMASSHVKKLEGTWMPMCR